MGDMVWVNCKVCLANCSKPVKASEVARNVRAIEKLAGVVYTVAG